MKLLVTDYDNTLEVHYDFTDNAAIFKRNMAALKKFMEKNIVCIATGRHFAAISKTLKENNIKFDYLCANNGAELYDCNYELLFCIPIDKKDLAVLMKLKEQVYFRNPFKSEKISSANIYINNLKKFKKMKQLLNNNLKESFVEYKYPKIKIINKKCNKLNAIYIIQNLEKINEAKIYTIGDDTNDVEMIMRYNGYSLTTACEETKRVALKVYEEFNQLIAEIDISKNSSNLAFLMLKNSLSHILYKRDNMFFESIHTRVRYIFLFVICLMLIIIAKVFYIQIFQYEKLNTLAESLWSRELPIKADRGEIVDRNGKVLATNITTTSLVIIPNQIVDSEAVAKDLSDILHSDYEDMLSHVTKKTSIERVHPEGRQLDYDTAEKIDNLNYDGVYLVKESKRYYPYGDVLSHVLGYVGIDNQGLSGLELYYDEYLTGADGAIKYFSDGRGNRLELSEVYEAPTSGVTLQLTIDIELQLSAENELDNVDSKYTADKSLIIAMDPDTGEILAMASRPTFDSNNYQNYATEVINRNLPIWMTYEPGSTFKIITLASAINENAINLFEDHYTDTGAIHVEGATLHCWKHGGHGNQTYLQVAENSCNPGFVTLGQKLGKETLMQYINDFGFGVKTGVDLNGESSGIMFNIDKMGPVELATTSFGQGISVTPLQQIRGVSAAINGGYLYTPYVVKALLESETESVIKLNEPIKVKQVISEESSKLVRYALESVVANGTGKNAYIENYRIGGKTGTAQKVKDGKYMAGNYILSFIGFLPADDPELVVYVAVDNPKGVTQYGGTVSAPIARNVMLSAIDIFGIKPSKDVMPREYTWLDTKYVTLPNVVGKSLDEAKKILKGFKIEYSGNGDTVLYQSPQADYYIPEGGEVLLMLN